MGLVEFLRQWQRGRLAAGIAVSILLHLVLILLAVGVRLPGRIDVKRGEPLIVELPRGDDSPPPGDGGAPASKPSRPSPPPAAPAPRMQARPAPPAPKVAAVPAPKSAEPARRSPPPAPRSEPEPARQVASAPAVPPADTGSVPAPQPAPAQPAPAPPAPAQSTPSPAEGTPAESAPQPPAQKQVASLPPQPAGRVPPDALSALRRGSGGAGGSGHGHAGIEGEPIPLDSTDPRYSDYLDQIRRRIKEKWGYPCEKNELTKVCEYRSTQLLIDFGINKNGELAYVTLVRTSGHPIYDDYALNAVKLASPFPPIPDSFSKTGVPIKANFHYVLQSSLTNILR